MAALFREAGVPVLEMHSRKSQGYRTSVSKQFYEGTNVTMFSSDVSARGMDYPGVTFILQMGLTDRSQYIHRLGRTARAGKAGTGLLLLAADEASVVRELTEVPVEPARADSDVTGGAAAGVPYYPASVTAKGGDRAPVASGVVAPDPLWTRTITAVGRKPALQREGALAYAAWLGFYNSNLRHLGWDKARLVAEGNRLFTTAMGLTEVPALQRKTVGKMGLRGTPGLVEEAKGSRGPGGAPQGGRGGGRGGGGGGGGGGGRGFSRGDAGDSGDSDGDDFDGATDDELTTGHKRRGDAGAVGGGRGGRPRGGGGGGGGGGSGRKEQAVAGSDGRPHHAASTAPGGASSGPRPMSAAPERSGHFGRGGGGPGFGMPRPTTAAPSRDHRDGGGGGHRGGSRGRGNGGGAGGRGGGGGGGRGHGGGGHW